MRFFPEDSPTTFSCFSPPVMLFTLLLEFISAIYIFVTAKLRPSTIIIMALLICLGIFQLAEFQVCAGDKTLGWMRLGYIAITFLPALGIHLVTLVTKRNWPRNVGYVLAFGFIGYFLGSAQSIHTVACGGNYVLINTAGVVASTYFPTFYYISLAIAVSEILSVTTSAFNGLRVDHDARVMLYWMLGGYASFIVPTAAIYFISPDLRTGVPSVMCGFAVFFALILTFFVYPMCKKLRI